MKTQIIQLEPHDDAISVKDKMDWRQTPRILLVWPVRGRILNRRLDLVFLQRHSASLGAQLALVTGDTDVRYHAEKLNILIYPTIHKAEQSHWRQPRRQRKKLARISKHSTPFQPSIAETAHEKPDLAGLRQLAHPTPARWLGHPIIRLLFFTLGVLGVLAIAAILVPSAEIRLTPRTQTEAVTISVEASPETASVDLSGAVPARWITVIVEGRGSIPSSGHISIPDRPATGEVTFTRWGVTDQDITIPAGTVISTLGEGLVRFATDQTITIPAEVVSETISVGALLPGSSGNVPAESILAIEGPLGLHLTVTNSEPTMGGTDRTAPAPSEGDYQKLYDELLAALRQTALTEFQANLGPDDVLLSAKPSLSQVLEETYAPVETQPADQLNLTLRMEFQALMAAGTDLRTLGQAALEANLPADFAPLPDTLVISPKSSPILENGEQANWQMRAQWEVGAQINATKAINLILWLKPEDAIDQLGNNLPLAIPAEITLTPDWWPRLPVLPFRVSVGSGQ
ncbi:MAG: baseplate J/gp47 family protein [Chloroflexi bacterium]|nr:baseplate J/gp47 family protein [Chloroflexota bacterium]MBU1662357.1 baseplate J/gp47 family protein [Chloroflexota bacterium]